MTWLWTFLQYVLPFLAVITPLVFIHELGHYLVARYFGVKVSVFSIGFGPEIIGWNDRQGTRWKISWLPLGGYVKMKGDANAASMPKKDAPQADQGPQKPPGDTLQGKTPWQRIAVSLAGPLANYILAVIVFFCIIMVSGLSTLTIDQIPPGSAAQRAGFLAGDQIVQVNNAPAQSFEKVARIVQNSPEKTLHFQVKRGSQLISLETRPQMRSVNPHKPGAKKIGYLGFSPKVEHPNPFVAFGAAVQKVWQISADILSSLGSIITGAQSFKSMGGALMMAKMSGDVFSAGLMTLLSFAALLSVNLGLINLLPIPALDGGHILLYGIEGVCGRTPSEKVTEWIYLLGMIFLLGVMTLAIWNDFQNLKLFSFFSKLIN